MKENASIIYVRTWNSRKSTNFSQLFHLQVRLFYEISLQMRWCSYCLRCFALLNAAKKRMTFSNAISLKSNVIQPCAMCIQNKHVLKAQCFTSSKIAANIFEKCAKKYMYATIQAKKPLYNEWKWSETYFHASITYKHVKTWIFRKLWKTNHHHQRGLQLDSNAFNQITAILPLALARARSPTKSLSIHHIFGI